MSAAPEPGGRMRVGYMGVGLMGHGAAKNILEKGYPLTVLGNVNRVPVDDLVARGAAEASSPADLVRRCDVVFLCLPSTVEVEQAAYAENGILSALRPGFILVDATTSDPVSTRRIGADLRAAGADMVDAPMGRTPKEAEQGALSSFVGGERATLDRVKPVIATFADTIIETGPLGSAHTVKLLNNFLAIGTGAIVGEALAAATLLGVDMNILRQVTTAGGANSVMLQRCLHWMIEGDDSHMQATMGIALKDLRYYRKMADEAGVGTALAEAASQTYRTAIQLGHARQFMPVLPSILAAFADGKPRDLPKR
jgi:3-hydroxyisobutyrate dehydrogenase-like beta-hydroxyacid dehydrogenase